MAPWRCRLCSSAAAFDVGELLVECLGESENQGGDTSTIANVLRSLSRLRQEP